MPHLESGPAAWLHAPAAGASADSIRRGRRLLWLCLAVYAAVLWFGVTPHEVGTSWRECDTMAIARNFLLDEFDPLRPRVDWRGDTDGAVECEFPLYQVVVAAALAVIGDVEWPARLLSLLAMLFACVSLHRLLEWRAGPGPALVGTMVFVWGAQAVLLGARVQPDGLSTALVLAGLATFLRYLSTGSPTAFWLAVAASTFGVLQKPTALQIVGLMGLLTILLAPRRLREPRLWLGFAILLAVVGAWLWHGTCLYQETGLTFGVLSGGETKFPGLRQLRDVHIWRSMLETTARIGFGPFGCLGLLWLVVRWRWDRSDLALLAVVGAGLVGSMRYSAYGGTGPHYHVFSAVAGAYCVARVWPQRAPRWLWAVALVGIAVVGAIWVHKERLKVERSNHNGQYDLALAIREGSAPDALAIVRGYREGYDAYWKRRTNYEEPAVLYQARRRGWVVPRDGFDVAMLERLRAKGASLVVNQMPKETSPEVQNWLAQNAKLVIQAAGGLVHRLNTAAHDK